MDENLLGYLLDALDADARRGVEAHLRIHPEARQRLTELRQLLAPLDADAETPEPPHQLAERTLARIVSGPSRRYPASLSQAGAPGRRNLRRADWIAAALMLILTAGLAMTWLARQWRDYKMVACQNNMRQLWTALQAYADQHAEAGGAFPRVEAEPPRNFAGVFVPVLASSGVLADGTPICPATGRRAPAPCSLIELDGLAHSRPDDYRARTRDLGGDYAYSLGYRVGDDLMGLTRDMGDTLPILADRADKTGVRNSPNHGGAGQNVLYIGGQVRWCAAPNVGVDRDDIYLNLNYRVLAGEYRFDTVLGASEAQPCLNP